MAIQSAIGLGKAGYDVVYFCGVKPIDPELEKNVKRIVCLDQKEIIKNGNHIRAAFQGIWNGKAYNEFNHLLDGISGPMVVHIHGWTKSLTSSIFKACNKHNIIPYVSIHDYFAACPNGGFYNYKNETICRMKGICPKCLFCNCDSRNYCYKLWRFLRQIIQDRYVRNSKRVIYVATSKFSYEAIKPSLKSRKVRYVRNPISIFSGEPVDCAKNNTFLFIGRLSREKGVDLFCEAMEKTNSCGVVIGSGDTIEELKKKYPKVDFVGWKNTDEIEEYVTRSRALVVPSRYYEGSPLIVPEMLSHGLPCIVPDRCAAREFIKSGYNGMIFHSSDVESLSRCIEKVKSESEDSMLFHSEKWNIRYVSLEKHINELLKAYGELH